MSTELLELVAQRFKALSDPARLRLVNALRDGQHTVTELTEQTGLSQANASKHLAQLHAMGFVTRRREGLFTYYALGDTIVLELCEVMCGRLEAEFADKARVLAR